MQKFKLGDIIIKGGKTYYARLVGEKETLFDEVELNGIAEGTTGISGWRTYGTSRSIIIGPEQDCKTGRCQPKEFNPATGRIETKRDEGIYPIIGTFQDPPFGSVMISLQTLTRYYPEIALRYSQAAVAYINNSIDARSPVAHPRQDTAAPSPDYVQTTMTIPGKGFRRAHVTEKGGMHLIRPTVDETIEMVNAPNKRALKKAVKKVGKKVSKKKPARKTTKRK